MRVNFNTPDWNLAGYVNDRSGDQLSLATGAPFFNDGTQVKLELQGNQVVNNGRTRLVFGGSYMNESLDSKDDNGTQTLYRQPIDTNEGALFGQVDFDLTERVTFMGVKTRGN